MAPRHSARAILLDADDRLLLIRRTKPGSPPYWTTPGGGVEDTDVSIEAAMHRELAEELGAQAVALSVKFAHRGTINDAAAIQYFFLARLIALDHVHRNGAELSEPERGGYDLERVELGSERLAEIDLRPPELKEFLHVHAAELIAEAASVPTRPSSGAP